MKHLQCVPSNEVCLARNTAPMPALRRKLFGCFSQPQLRTAMLLASLRGSQRITHGEARLINRQVGSTFTRNLFRYNQESRGGSKMWRGGGGGPLRCDADAAAATRRCCVRRSRRLQLHRDDAEALSLRPQSEDMALRRSRPCCGADDSDAAAVAAVSSGRGACSFTATLPRRHCCTLTAPPRRRRPESAAW